MSKNNTDKVLIIAEAGVNHNGSIENAKKLIDAAADAGADYVKFQTFKSENLVTKNAEQANYQKETAKDDSQLAMLRKLELSEDQHIDLINYCDRRDIKFLSTAFDMDSIKFLSSLNLDLWKIPSGEITNYPYLKLIGSFKTKTILSTGMSHIDEIRDAVSVLLESGLDKNDLTVLHCNTEYPTPFEDVNITAMNTIGDSLNVSIGYSDHTLGIEVPIAAVALGATVIEKHFTLDKTMQGPDHSASLEPKELKNMVRSIRNIEKTFGNGEKRPSESEIKNIESIRKSIVAKKNISKGEMFTEDNLTTKRPGSGKNPMLWNSLIGSKAEKNYEVDDFI